MVFSNVQDQRNLSSGVSGQGRNSMGTVFCLQVLPGKEIADLIYLQQK